MQEEEQDVYETINIPKLKQFLPNLKVVNLWGVSLFCAVIGFSPFASDKNRIMKNSKCK